MKKNWISWLALALSIAACIITWLRVEIYTTNDTFVGVMAGFMGACATIIVGFQIFNSIETKRDINELKESYKIKISDIEKVQKELENQIKDSKIKELTIESFAYQAYAITIYQEQPFTAYSVFYTALKLVLESNKNGHISTAINNHTTLSYRIPQIEYKEINKIGIDDVKNINLEELKIYQSYDLVKIEIIENHKKIIDYINKNEKC
mgnify:CR=1 FL=1